MKHGYMVFRPEGLECEGACSVYVRLYIHIYTHTLIYIYIYIYIYTHTHRNAHPKYAYMHTRIHMTSLPYESATHACIKWTSHGRVAFSGNSSSAWYMWRDPLVMAAEASLLEPETHRSCCDYVHAVEVCSKRKFRLGLIGVESLFGGGCWGELTGLESATLRSRRLVCVYVYLCVCVCMCLLDMISQLFDSVCWCVCVFLYVCMNMNFHTLVQVHAKIWIVYTNIQGTFTHTYAIPYTNTTQHIHT